MHDGYSIQATDAAVATPAVIGSAGDSSVPAQILSSDRMDPLVSTRHLAQTYFANSLP
jgi:hypothetical protein